MREPDGYIPGDFLKECNDRAVKTLTNLPDKPYHIKVTAKLCASPVLYKMGEQAVRHEIDKQLSQHLAKELLSVGQKSEHYDHREALHVIDLEVYAFTPAQFVKIIREEAQRLLDRSLNPRPRY